MFITSREEKFYKIEMTQEQAHNLLTFLLCNADGHVNELAVQAEWGAKMADSVHETLKDLRTALENR